MQDIVDNAVDQRVRVAAAKILTTIVAQTGQAIDKATESQAELTSQVHVVVGMAETLDQVYGDPSSPEGEPQ